MDNIVIGKAEHTNDIHTSSKRNNRWGTYRIASH